MLRDILKIRPTLRLILMSATLSATKFADYFGGSASVPMLAIPGFSYPVQDFFLEDIIEATNWRPPVGGGGGKASFGTGQRAPPPPPQHDSGGVFDGKGGAGQAGLVKLQSGYSDGTSKAVAATEQDALDYELIQTALELICGGGASTKDSRESVPVAICIKTDECRIKTDGF